MTNNRLVSAAVTGQPARTFTSDNAGNITLDDRGAGNTVTITIGADGRPQTVVVAGTGATSVAYKHNARGIGASVSLFDPRRCVKRRQCNNPGSGGVHPGGAGLSRGGFTFRPDPGRAPVEIHGLADPFGKMARAISQHERRLERVMVHRDGLIAGIHHRVKNNLQMVASLLSLQTTRAPSEEAGEALNAARRRVLSLAVRHKHLFERDDGNRVVNPTGALSLGGSQKE